MDKQPQERRLNVRPIVENTQTVKFASDQPDHREELMEAIKAFRRRSRTAVHIPKPKKERKKRGWFKKNEYTGNKEKHFSLFSSMQGQIAICSAIVLAAMGIKAIDLPAAQMTSAIVKDAVTMEMEIDEPLGGLTFVQNMFPETVAVLWQQSATDELQSPVNGTVTGRYSISSPGLSIKASDPKVYACWQGEVKSVEKEQTGDVTVTVSHSGGLETVYARLSAAAVKEGDQVDKGERIGDCSGEGDSLEMFLQVRLSGVVVDPTPYFQ